MQLIAHSVVPSNPVPYLHLGYLAAQGQTSSSMSPAQGMLLFAAIASGIGLILIATVFLRRSRIVLLIGITLLMCGVAGLILSRELPNSSPVVIPAQPASSAQP